MQNSRGQIVAALSDNIVVHADVPIDGSTIQPHHQFLFVVFAIRPPQHQFLPVVFAIDSAVTCSTTANSTVTNSANSDSTVSANSDSTVTRSFNGSSSAATDSNRADFTVALSSNNSTPSWNPWCSQLEYGAPGSISDQSARAFPRYPCIDEQG
eukprot:CAMPEP_0194068244 /NCGR_PEP_ID=MMETSP0009_2-20130614/86990_1 /TAXON_ID=210454 /ORGANISM="Grammatophora oceanica, Strain CCMP 410" /LENGTH=153 /DNA_ID=CAMNT_0038721323 /DNA_START=118 /DNA_END=579 /DNA_ORIENTATION=-